MRRISLDTETTGLSPSAGHRITEIGCIELIDRKVTGNSFQTYINPERELDEGAARITGLSWQMLKKYPKFSQVVDELLAFIDGAELIIHNAPFDVGFLNHEFNLLNTGIKAIDDTHNIIDTLGMARNMHPGQKNNLDALCKRYNIDNSHRDLHGALLDAEILARVYLAMTAGQISLGGFHDQQAAERQTNRTGEQVKTMERKYDIPVIEATPDENTAHLSFLKLLNESNGEPCVWSEIEK